MSVAKLSLLTAIGTALAIISAAAWSAPVVVNPGDTGIAVPTFAGTGMPTVDLLFDTGNQTLTMNGITVNFEEFAVKTSLNPAGVSFGFAIAASNKPTSLGAALPGYGGFMTSVESCDPFTMESTQLCGTSTGTVSRSSGTGDMLTFSGIGTTPVMLDGSTINASNVYGIFTNAPGWTDPGVTVTDDGTSFMFKGVGPSATSAPEPATLGLFGLGLLGTALARRRRRSV